MRVSSTWTLWNDWWERIVTTPTWMHETILPSLVLSGRSPRQAHRPHRSFVKTRRVEGVGYNRFVTPPRSLHYKGFLGWVWREVSRWRQITLTNKSTKSQEIRQLWLVFVDVIVRPNTSQQNDETSKIKGLCSHLEIHYVLSLPVLSSPCWWTYTSVWWKGDRDVKSKK